MTGINYLTIDEIRTLENEIDSRRDRLILRLLYETGCTVAELVNIKVSDISFERYSITFPVKKTKNSERESFVSKKLCGDLLNLTKRQGSEYVFVSRQSSQITPKRVRQLVQGYAKNAGFSEVGPQTIRYSHIAHAINKNIPLTTIQKQVGMKELRIMQLYKSVTALQKEDGYKTFWSEED